MKTRAQKICNELIQGVANFIITPIRPIVYARRLQIKPISVMNYRREVDGLRAVAVIPVIFFHAGFQTFSGGFVGVDVFFVISGYLITSLILAEKQAGTFSLIRFYERRARRILPALFLVMFACLPLAWLWLLPEDMQRFSQSLVAVSAFSSNVQFWLQSGYFDTANELKPLLHTWSLAVEEQYYLLFPIFLLLTWRLGKRWIIAMLAAIAIISLAAAQWGSTSHPSATFYLLPTRGWELLLGAFAAFYLFETDESATTNENARQAFSVIGLLLIAYAVFAFSRQTPIPSFYALIPTIGTAFVILFATQQTLVGKLLGSKPLVGIGLISYSAYLWHQPLFAFARHRLLDEPSTALLVALAAAALLLAYLSWKYVETPFRNRQRIERNKVFFLGASCSALFVGIGLVGDFDGGFSIRFDEKTLAALLTKSEGAKLGDGGCHLSEDTYKLAGCSKGAATNKSTIAIWGDSHASALVYELGKALAKRDLRVIQYTKNACPVSLDLYTKGSTKMGSGQNTNCEKYTKSVLDDLETNGVDTVVIFSRWGVYLEGTPFDNGEGGVEKDLIYIRAANSANKLNTPYSNDATEVIRSYTSALASLLRLNKKIILVYPTPEVGWNVPDRLVKLLMYGDPQARIQLTTAYQTFKKRNDLVNKSFDAIRDDKNLVRIKPEEIFCNTYVKDRCIAELNGVPLYFDDDHMSNAGARLVVDEIMKHVSK
jgi:peptidoglycan/LPS O-acetylase OafA/YrhL